MSISITPRLSAVAAAVFVSVLTACGASFPQPQQVRVPTPQLNNSGKYLSPYTSDGTIAPWVRNARAAGAGASIGGFVGRQAGERALKSVPLVGGMLGKKAGSTAGRKIAIEMVGGESALKSGSDISFARAEDLAVFLYAFQPTDSSEIAQKQQVIGLTQKIYPDVLDKWTKSISKARLAKNERQLWPSGVPGAPK